jgi:biotin carboxylase
LLRDGELTVLALFDKPDPLVGPFFEETIYVTPSRLAGEAQERIARVASHGALALGLRDGPVHAELRLNEAGPWLIEIAARSIGGLCSRTLRFGTAMSLEELILRHALRMEMPEPERERRAAGVMMIPIPRAGILGEVRGLEDARAVADIEDVTISIHVGQRLVPLPEGSRYLGFIFSRAASPERAEAALREAHALLEFEVRGP